MTQGAPAQKASKVRAIQKAISAYLVAAAEKEKGALAKAVKACDRSLADATAALRTLPPLTKAKKGTRHGLKFQSGDHDWEYYIRLPKGYDNKKRYPVLVLPDHGSVGSPTGSRASWWTASSCSGR